MGVAEKLKELPPLATLLKVSTIGCAVFLAVMGGVFMFFSVFNLSISSAFIGFYLLCVASPACCLPSQWHAGPDSG